MPNLRVPGLIAGALVLVAIACGGASTGVPPATPEAAPADTRVPPTEQRLAPDPLLETPPTPRPAPSVVADRFVEVEPTGLVEPDPDYLEGLRSSRFSTSGWKTDWRYHTVPYSEFIGAGPTRDGIPPLDNPRFISLAEADAWLSPPEPVIAFELNGDQRAYPIQILMWHEVVNDVVGGVPVTVTFCPLCNSAIVFERTVDGLVLDFAASGNLRNSDLVMWDRQTESWWQQFTGEALVGVMAGTKLEFLPAPILSWEDYKINQPDGSVLSRNTGFSRRYGQNPYVGYDRADNPPFLFDGEMDGRLQPKERVAAITVDGVDAAFPHSILKEEEVVNYRLNGVDLTVFFKAGTSSALDGPEIGFSRDVGSTAVFNAVLDGRKLTFSAAENGFTDAETGSTWSILGEAIDGPLTGQQLTKIIHSDHFWFAWAAFKPDTLIYKGQS